jgi:hypothetical protein
MARPESSATMVASDCPFDIGANGTIVAGWSDALALINAHSIRLPTTYDGPDE